MRFSNLVLALVSLACRTTATDRTITETHVSTVTEVSTLTEVSTEVSVSTCYVTVPTTVYSTQLEVSTALQWTTEFVTSTMTTTYETSYPVPTTVLVNCTPRSGSSAPTGYDIEPADRTPEHDNECDTVTITSWRTTTRTEEVTVVNPTTVLTTVPTTVEIQVPTVIPTSIDVISWVTVSAPGETVTAPGGTVTAPGETITLPGETVTVPPETVTLPPQTTTVPAATIVTTITTQLPPRTFTTTVEGQVITTTLPAEVTTTTLTAAIPPATVTLQGATLRISNIFQVSLCPEPTGTYRRLAPNSNLVFGCSPGYVCNPPMPNGCNKWPGLPSRDFVCDPNDCIQAPAFEVVQWSANEVGYYPPAFGYFDLNPERFGLSYGIFEREVHERVEDGQTITFTTGNWGAHPTPSAQSRPSGNIVRREERGPWHSFVRRQSGGTPGVCFDECNAAMRVVEGDGITDTLCLPGSDFWRAYTLCENCVRLNDNPDDSVRDYIRAEFEQFLGVCNTDGVTPPGNSTFTPPFSSPDAASTLPDQQTITQVVPSATSFIIPTDLISTTDISTVVSTDPVSSLPTETSAIETSTPETSTSSEASTVASSIPDSVTDVETSSPTSAGSPGTTPFTTLTSLPVPPTVSVVTPGAAPRVAIGAPLVAPFMAILATLFML
ncbi:hypothetical protein S7711_00451 [Stachybotrys chartarum IBT 7711]|uniref:Glycoprotein X n=1 Tax=Stachybotrys chartarum (strain CBS 109288 / IBT 7711) TaxID=1280523 RepID=A0A084B9R5_STACB|nr:hypothetical protein S7711_00451 [Stachybotrys chartarum IBT 7711]